MRWHLCASGVCNCRACGSSLCVPGSSCTCFLRFGGMRLPPAFARWCGGAYATPFRWHEGERQRKFPCVQHHARRLAVFVVGGIAYYRMPERQAVDTKLMPTPRRRMQFHFGHGPTSIGSNSQPDNSRVCGTTGNVCCPHHHPEVVARVVSDGQATFSTRGRHVTFQQGQVNLFGLALLEQPPSC